MNAPVNAVLGEGRFGLSTIRQEGTRVPAVLTDHGVVPLASLVGDAPASVRGLLPDWAAWCDRIEAALAAGGVPWTPAGEVDFDAPLPDPANLYLAGANYHDHVAEMSRYSAAMGRPFALRDDDEVFHFMVPSTSLVGTGHEIVRPARADQLDWEVELAVVIGRRADAVPAERALDVVAGYAVANDVSWRGPLTMHPVFGVRFLAAKGQATLTPFGPAIVPARFVPDPQALTLSTHVNGEVRQHSSTAQMIATVRDQIALLSSRVPLEAGDVILTGTPAGTAAAHGTFLADGDVVTTTVEGLGVLTNTVAGTRAHGRAA